jgi:hypothetical protein
MSRAVLQAAPAPPASPTAAPKKMTTWKNSSGMSGYLRGFRPLVYILAVSSLISLPQLVCMCRISQ